MDERFAHDRFLVDQLVRPLINLYRERSLVVAGQIEHVPVAELELPVPAEPLARFSAPASDAELKSRRGQGLGLAP